MPVQTPPVHPHPFKAFRTLRHAAQDGMVMELHCNHCRKSVTFLAHDLLRVCSPDHPAHLPPFGCARCGTIEYVTSGGLTARLARLEKRGLVARIPDAGDKRSLLVALTPLGLERARAAIEADMHLEATLLDGLSSQEQAELAQLLGKLALSLEAKGL